MLQLFSCFVLVVLPSAQTLTGADGLIVRLKDEASVQSAEVLLRDIADLEGGDPGENQKISAVSFGPAPAYGAASVLSRYRIQECILSQRGSLAGIALSGAVAVHVRTAGRSVSPDEIAPLLFSYLSKAAHWKASEITILSIGNTKGIELPPDQVELRLSSGSATFPGRKKILVPIEVVKEGKVLRCFWITAEVAIHAPIMTASQKISFDKIITPDDIHEETVEIPDLRAVYARRAEDLVGKASRRSFDPGEPLAVDSFVNPYLVRNGETVQLHLERNGISLTSLARAEQNGRLGQVIRVRNLDFSTTLEAQVTGRAAVRIQ